ncbi:hypothetical protein HRW18_04910 [Streptomyces lunaelactis]|nr:hypothetical protein [Streptomyces lunaelactis]NUK33750.1 hypothetical protein [Streptomyces lunaelactis]NUK44395.1 hypothetical protein [Streptomyces lunaelactis]NUK56168.1 hypothetical protein [Streptomyces lunaelactis]NUK91018.1 hypothetical protein [Streptomyces lunaelactis]
MVHAYTRAVGVAARVLFVVVLALGVFIMHTVGHPSGGSGSHMSATPHTVGTHTVGTLSMHGDGDGGTHPATPNIADSPVHGPETANTVSAPHHPGMAMDLASLCLAVLGAWALAFLLYAAFTSRRDGLADLTARVITLVSPDPPPRPPDLAQLSILRI